MFWCFVFGVCVCECEFVLSSSKVLIDRFVCIYCVGDGEMETSSKCACGIVICIDYFAFCVFVIAKSCVVMQFRADWFVIVVFDMIVCVCFYFIFLCWYCRCE